MGQLVAVVEKPSSLPGVIRYEANRSLTGMGHETFTSVDGAVGPRPAAVLARRLLESGQVESVHMYGNQVTVNLTRGSSGGGLDAVVRDLYQYWKPGMEPQTFDAPEAEAAPAAPAAGGDAAPAESEYTRRVPAHLIERSSTGLARWKANHG